MPLDFAEQGEVLCCGVQREAVQHLVLQSAPAHHLGLRCHGTGTALARHMHGGGSAALELPGACRSPGQSRQSCWSATVMADAFAAGRLKTQVLSRRTSAATRRSQAARLPNGSRRQGFDQM
mmetsp:Transcript_15733/g.49497  ORF Transcript_15733/g.49497 Transcript_15733/m.49497 type:complete len:122 (+) Transcript_15733:3-368(+)